MKLYNIQSFVIGLFHLLCFKIYLHCSSTHLDPSLHVAILSTDVWVPGHVPSSPAPLGRAPEYHHSPRRLSPLMTNYPNKDFFNRVLFFPPSPWDLAA